MDMQRILIILLLAGSLLVLTKGLWRRKKPGPKGCSGCSGCG
jgi:hypothetical protein